MTKVAWSRDGDQWVGTLGKREARITEWCGALGSEFLIQVDGRSRGGAGGGTRADALKRAKAIAAELLASTHKLPSTRKIDEAKDETMSLGWLGPLP